MVLRLDQQGKHPTGEGPQTPLEHLAVALGRLLESCPVHEALSPGVPVAVALATDLTAADNWLGVTGEA